MGRRAVVMGVLLALAGPAGARGPGAAARYRQAVMRSLGNDMAALSLIAEGEVDRLDEAARIAGEVEETAGRLASLFPAGTGPEAAHTGARDEAFRDSAGFAAAATTLAGEARGVGDAARAGDHAALAARFAELAAGCTACHSKYRVPN